MVYYSVLIGDILLPDRPPTPARGPAFIRRLGDTALESRAQDLLQGLDTDLKASKK